MWNITLLWLFYCPACPVLVILFFSQLRPGQTHGRILTIYGLNDASSPKDVPFGVWMTTHTIKGFKPPKKGAWLGFFQPKWQNCKIVISPSGNIGSIPYFDRVIEPHSWLRGWFRIARTDGQICYINIASVCWRSIKTFGNYDAPLGRQMTSKLNKCVWGDRGTDEELVV